MLWISTSNSLGWLFPFDSNILSFLVLFFWNLRSFVPHQLSTCIFERERASRKGNEEIRVRDPQSTNDGISYSAWKHYYSKWSSSGAFFNTWYPSWIWQISVWRYWLSLRFCIRNFAGILLPISRVPYMDDFPDWQESSSFPSCNLCNVLKELSIRSSIQEFRYGGTIIKRGSRYPSFLKATRPRVDEIAHRTLQPVPPSTGRMVEDAEVYIAAIRKWREDNTLAKQFSSSPLDLLIPKPLKYLWGW